jgi:coenzyme F420-reducing hydrogenase delta subunit
MASRKCERITVFACGTALNRMPTAGNGDGVKVTRLGCAGSVNAGMVLGELEADIDRVLILGCGDGACRHETGTAVALKQARLAWRLVETLGLDPHRIALELVDRDGSSLAVSPKAVGDEK